MDGRWACNTLESSLHHKESHTRTYDIFYTLLNYCINKDKKDQAKHFRMLYVLNILDGRGKKRYREGKREDKYKSYLERKYRYMFSPTFAKMQTSYGKLAHTYTNRRITAYPSVLYLSQTFL